MNHFHLETPRLFLCHQNKAHKKLKRSWIYLHLQTGVKICPCLADDQHLRDLQCYLTASIRGNPILWDRLQNSYYRIKTSQKKLKSVWKCRQPGCKARVHTNDITNVIIKTTNEHVHEVTVLDLRSIDPKGTSAENQEKNTSATKKIAVTEDKSVMQGNDDFTAGREKILGIDERDNKKN
jgi:hypothetical protein